jgi:nicotinate-nucleotide adenylyltransferase
LGGVRLGVFGGTFNPIHLGHLYIARACQRLFSLSQVHFVVAASPPHKSAEALIPFTHRYAMACLATSGAPTLIPSLIELEPQASPYSIDTLRKLAHRIDKKRDALYFIAGGDSLSEIMSWRENETLLTSYNFIFVMRAGMRKVDPKEVLPRQALARVRNLAGMGRILMKRQIAEEENSGENRIYIVDLGAPDISATHVRSQIKAGRPIRAEVPSPVCDYIRKLNLYGAR